MPPQAPIDVEAIVVGALDDAAKPASRVRTELEPGHGYPIGRVVLLPGGGQADGDHEDHRLTRDRLQLESFGDPDVEVDGKADARRLIEEMVTAALGIGGTVAGIGTVTAVILESSPYWLPDPLDDGPRYIATIAVYSHP